MTQRSLNSSFIDSTDYTSLQASSSFQPIGKDFNQAYSSLNFNQNYGYDPYADSRCANFYFIFSFACLKSFKCPYLKIETISLNYLDQKQLFRVE